MTSQRGFTILEMLIVITIIGILVTLAEPMWSESVTRAREVALRQTLVTIRDVLDQVRADRGKYPASLRELVTLGYLRALPIDPMTKSSATWQEVRAETEEGIYDVHSGSAFVGADGTPYNQW